MSEEIKDITIEEDIKDVNTHVANNNKHNTDNEVGLTIFDSSFVTERKRALQFFAQGATPKSEIRERDSRGGGKSKYVNGYYMFRQISLITNFRWSHEVLKEKFRPDEINPVEIGTFVRIKIWDNNGQEYSHTAWGSKDVARYKKDTYKKDFNPATKTMEFIDLGIDHTDTTWKEEKRKQRHIYEIDHHKGEIISLFDDMKASETDAIKKALSYFGIANDIYGGKEKQFKDQTSEEEDGNGDASLEVGEEYQEFDKWLKRVHIRWSEVYEILKVDKIIDYKESKKKIMEVKGIKE